MPRCLGCGSDQCIYPLWGLRVWVACGVCVERYEWGPERKRGGAGEGDNSFTYCIHGTACVQDEFMFRFFFIDRSWENRKCAHTQHHPLKCAGVPGARPRKGF